MRREIKEELLCDVQSMEFLTVYDAHRQLPDGAKTHWIAIIYAAQVDPEQVGIGEPGKVTEIGWFTSKNLPTPQHSQLHKSFDIALARGIIK